MQNMQPITSIPVSQPGQEQPYGVSPNYNALPEDRSYSVPPVDASRALPAVVPVNATGARATSMPVEGQDEKDKKYMDQLEMDVKMLRSELAEVKSKSVMGSPMLSPRMVSPRMMTPGPGQVREVTLSRGADGMVGITWWRPQYDGITAVTIVALAEGGPALASRQFVPGDIIHYIYDPAKGKLDVKNLNLAEIRQAMCGIPGTDVIFGVGSSESIMIQKRQPGVQVQRQPLDRPVRFVNVARSQEGRLGIEFNKPPIQIEPPFPQPFTITSVKQVQLE